MTFAPANEANIRIAVLLKLETVNPLTAARWILMSDGEFVGDWVDGTERAWEGRIVGTSTLHFPRQKLRSAKWSPPTCSFSIKLGDRDDDFWDYLDPTVYTWDGSSATVYLVDADQGDAAGAEVFLFGIVKGGPRGAKLNSTLRITLVDQHNITLPCNQYSMPSETRTGFVAPAAQDGGGQVLDGAITAAATTITIAVTTGEWIAGRVVVCEDEAMYIVSKNGNDLVVTRGYAGTIAFSHANGLTVRCYRNGPHAGLVEQLPTGGYDTVLQYVFGQSGMNRGPCIPVWPMAFEDSGLTGNFEWWFTRGKVAIGQLDGLWDNIGGLITSHVIDGDWPWNDLDNPNSGGTGAHRTPNILLAGSYIDIRATGYIPDAAWIRSNGIDDGGGNVLRYPCGIADYLATDTTWACGFTSPFYGNRITAWNAGDWADEYSGVDYWDDIQGVCPSPGSREAPGLMDSLHDLGRLVGSAWTTREGLLYPHRLYIASGASTDLTVTPDYMDEGAVPEVMFDPDGDMCNVLDMSVSQDVLNDPDPAGANEYDPEAIPFKVTVQDSAAIVLRGDEVRGEMVTKYFWIRADLGWVYKEFSAFTDQTQHLKTMELAADDHLLVRSQEQIYMRAKLSHRALSSAHVGKIITYDYPPYTSTQGLIREVKITVGGGKVTPTITSMHLEEWPS